MATVTTRRRRPGVTLVVFVLVLLVLIAIMALSKSWTPKLGLDLSGGTTITLTATNPDNTTIDPKALAQAQLIIQSRVDSLGVGESVVALAGNNQIQVSAPNVTGDELVALVGQTAQLEFRRVYQTDPDTGGVPSGQATDLPQVPDSVTPRPTAPSTDLPADQAGRQTLLATQLAWTPTDQDKTDYTDYKCGDYMPQVWDQPFFACLRDDIAGGGGNQKYLLGPRLIEGSLVKNATAGIRQNDVAWSVNLNFDSLGAALFSDATGTLYGATSPTDQFAIVLDGKVISAPSVNAKITNGSAEISGSFNQSTATNLANVLNYGALPLAFELSNVETISATLGGDQLTAGLIAGGIGLLLVVGYSLIYYRGLALVVTASLMMAAGVTYSLVVLLGEAMGVALSLPGLAGVIVAIGVTADSFVIYFERVRDEAREGRSIRSAVETGWDKARRTIVVADAVSLLSAVILYILSVATVKGFAFMLGLTTLVDLALIFFFTKPLMSLLVRTSFFGTGKRFSGFEAAHLGLAETRRPRPRGLATAKGV